MESVRPLRRAPMMLGGVGFQAGLDEVRGKQIEARRQAAVSAAWAPVAPGRDVVQQLRELKALHDDGVLSAEEFRMAKRKHGRVLDTDEAVRIPGIHGVD